ncbi:MAG TPA: hypothetical protein VFK02_02210 [Kofleriaceae bacterium]|nr:hypothetical protein [Kofleriaceae bacterium]
MRQVRGVLFVDYVRMLRSQKSTDWSRHLAAHDLPYLQMHIDPDGWYPMATFERMGNAILTTVARGELFPVQLWGRYSAAQLKSANPMLLEPNDPPETLSRFRVLRETFFNFNALEVPLLHDDEAHVVVRYYMGMPAEEAASYQTMGFFEGLLELAGATEVRAAFQDKSWEGDPRTLLVIRWRPPRRAVATA